ncbi:hypothetical protein LTR16_002361, partial [Cryomyces antarcticus]
SNIIRIPDVERNGRIFSDGVGSISPKLLKKVWQSTLSRELKPSALQIRFGGYKGMVSVDTRVKGETLWLRESMRKFDAHDAMEIEICGANSRSLPMYLNRPLIKILEDLGVSPDALLDLQADVVENLRTITTSPINAASFWSVVMLAKLHAHRF